MIKLVYFFYNFFLTYVMLNLISIIWGGLGHQISELSITQEMYFCFSFLGGFVFSFNPPFLTKKSRKLKTTLLKDPNKVM